MRFHGHSGLMKFSCGLILRVVLVLHSHGVWGG